MNDYMLYKTDERINSILAGIVNPETGEVEFTDEIITELNGLNLQRSDLLEQVGVDYKNNVSMIDMLKKEKAALDERIKACTRRADNDKSILNHYLAGNKFESAKVAVSFRKLPPSVKLDDDFVAWAKVNADHYLRYKEPEADKTAIKNALKAGAVIEHAELVQDTAISIK